MASYSIEARSNEGPAAYLTSNTKKKAEHDLNLVAYGFAFQLAVSFASDGCIAEDVDKWARSFTVIVKKNGRQIVNAPVMNLLADSDGLLKL